jgi:hypothetical protein
MEFQPFVEERAEDVAALSLIVKGFPGYFKMPF